MKKTDVSKLALKVTTIRLLTDDSLRGVAGGIPISIQTDCSGSCTTTTKPLCFTSGTKCTQDSSLCTTTLE